MESAEHSFEVMNEIPLVMFNRLLSLRAFDVNGMMIDARLAKGDEIDIMVKELLNNNTVSHIDAHNAVPGCFSGRIARC